jgi:acyl-CoA oxidase
MSLDGAGGPQAVDAVALRRLLDGPNRDVREHVRAVLRRPEFGKPPTPPPTEEYRAKVSEWTRTLASTGGTALGFPAKFGGLDRVGGAVSAFEVLAHHDLSLLVKCGVQFGLFGGAVLHLGTRRHHERYLHAIASFEAVRVPREALLDRYAEVTDDGDYRSPIESSKRRFFTMLGTLIQGRISVGGAALSATKSALAIAVRHALRRRQFGAPDSTGEALLLDYRAHQRRLLPALARTYALHCAQQEVVGELDRIFGGGIEDTEESERDRRRLETRAAGLKALATWHATETIQAARECCGGAGYMAANRFGELKADTDVFTTFEGDNTILLQLVAKSLLTGYRDQFGDLNPFETAGFLAGQVWETVVERSAAREILQRLGDDLVPGRERDEDLLDRDYHLGLFRWREDHMLSGVARRLRRGIDGGGDPFAVFNDCQDHVLATARAHVEREVLEAFVRAIEDCADEDLRGVLERLCDLHALANLEADRAWLQEHGRISSTRAKTLTRTVNRLCAELRPLAGELVDAFGIPDELLAAPIGLPVGEASRSAAAEIGDTLPDARMLAAVAGKGAGR